MKGKMKIGFNLFPIFVVPVSFSILIVFYIAAQGNENAFLEHVTFDFSSRLRMLLLDFVNAPSKRVYFGVLNDTPVVVKIFPNSTSCVGVAEECMEKYARYTSYDPGELKPLVVCPESTGAKILAEKDILQSVNFEQVTEILLKKLLPASNNWPVPNQYSYFQNTILEEYVGPSLTSLSLDSFETRMMIALGLLRLADVFTFKHEKFRIYWTDISPDNVAVRANFDVVLVDLDNAILVDKTHISDDPAWKDVHVSELWNQEEGFVFSTVDVCRHSLSDHNFYAVCNHILVKSDILGDGLLSNIPDDINELYPDLNRLLTECTNPKFHPSRISAAHKLIELIEGVLSK